VAAGGLITPAKFVVSRGEPSGEPGLSEVRWKLVTSPCYTHPFAEEIIACAVSFLLLSPSLHSHYP
jgi:hypothetical protein